MARELPACAACGIANGERACRVKDGKGPVFCPTRRMTEAVQRAMRRYAEPATREFARQASIQEAEGYVNRGARPRVPCPVKSRLEETGEFAGRMGYRRLGVAYCAGLQAEGAALVRFLEARGFEVASVVCKVGCTPKEEIGVEDREKIRVGEFEPMCSPIAQAEVLNEARTEFNIVLGLCVGHDSLFFAHSRAPATVLAAKDRVLGHNPLAALYTLGSYYARLLES